MGKGFFIGTKGKYMEKSVQDSGELGLLARGDGSEVMLQKIKADKTVFIQPGGDEELMEFFYILEGRIKIRNSDMTTTLGSGDYFYSHQLDQNVQFHTLSDVTLLYYSTMPVFHYISSTIRDLNKLAGKVEEKDIHTFGHNRRVMKYAVKIGNKLGLSNDTMERIAFASLFHDLGKIRVPYEILNKPGALTVEEFELIKKHPVDGKKLVDGTYYEGITEIIEQHHERLDGSGYPGGLKEEEILLEAKIIAVSDAFDAMTSDRAYRKAMKPQEAVDELKRFSGKHYDEGIVGTLIEILKEEHEI